MYLENRPTCVTVIGWAWIIMGVVMCFSAIMAILSSFMISEMIQNDPNTHFIVKIFPLIATVQIVVSVFGLISGINFLKLKSWSRNVLEILTWALLLLIAAFSEFAVYQMISTLSSNPSFGFGIMEVVFIVGILGFYVVPLGISQLGSWEQLGEQLGSPING